MNKTKIAHAKQTFLRLKVYLALYIEEFTLLCNIMLFLLKSLGARTLFMIILNQIIIKSIWLLFTGLKQNLFTTPYFLLQNVAFGLSI